jgi:chromosome segregation ATPase
MEKPPTKEELIFDWFLGEAKEISQSLEKSQGETVAIAERLDSAKAELSETLNAATHELVAAHHELRRHMAEVQTDNGKLVAAITSAVRKAATMGQRQMMVVATLCAGVGGFVGAAAALLGAYLLRR